ncbi:MAG: hypothetical protein HXX81_00015 [Campylobacterales bacterium]|nr:hypothetical protein [Campylobacterales bacterium]
MESETLMDINDEMFESIKIESKTNPATIKILRALNHEHVKTRNLVLENGIKLNNVEDLALESNYRLNRVEKDVNNLKQDVEVLKQDVSVLKDDVTILKQDVSVLKDDMKEVKTKIGSMDTKLDQISQTLVLLLNKQN